MHDPEYYRRNYRAQVLVGHQHCRDVTVRTHRHGEVIIRQIRRCFR
jgi:hypothetical protein